MWWKRKKDRVLTERPNADAVASKIAKAFMRFQTGVSNKVNRLLSRMPPLAIRLVFILLCLGGASYSGYLIIKAVVQPKKNVERLAIETIEVPKHLHDQGDQLLKSSQPVDQETYEDIRAFRNYMDSLQIHHPAIYDSIIRARPGLMDSVLLLENIYHSQLQK